MENISAEDAKTIVLVTMQAYQNAADKLIREAEELALLAMDKKDLAVALLDRCATIAANHAEASYLVGEQDQYDDIQF